MEINWDTKETELAAKSIDCIWNGLTLTDDREENMACTKPYVKNAQVVVVKDWHRLHLHRRPHRQDRGG